MELNLRPYCPVNGWDCPYWCYDGTCKLENPAEDCDDFATFEDFFSDLPASPLQETLEEGKHIVNDEIVPPLDEIVDKIFHSYKSPSILSWAPGEPLPEEEEEECFEPGRPVNDIMALNP